MQHSRARGHFRNAVPR